MLARDYATLPFGLLKRAIWPQMSDHLPLLHVSSVTFPWRAMQLIEESASLCLRNYRFVLAADIDSS